MNYVLMVINTKSHYPQQNIVNPERPYIHSLKEAIDKADEYKKLNPNCTYLVVEVETLYSTSDSE